jgi:hypothetical protein
MAESGFLTNIFKLSFQFSVTTTVGKAVMLYDVCFEAAPSKFGFVTDCSDRGFSCFHSVPEFTLGTVPGSGHVFLPNSF